MFVEQKVQKGENFHKQIQEKIKDLDPFPESFELTIDQVFSILFQILNFPNYTMKETADTSFQNKFKFSNQNDKKKIISNLKCN